MVRTWRFVIIIIIIIIVFLHTKFVILDDWNIARIFLQSYRLSVFSDGLHFSFLREWGWHMMSSVMSSVKRVLVTLFCLLCHLSPSLVSSVSSSVSVVNSKIKNMKGKKSVLPWHEANNGWSLEIIQFFEKSETSNPTQWWMRLQ